LYILEIYSPITGQRLQVSGNQLKSPLIRIINELQVSVMHETTPQQKIQGDFISDSIKKCVQREVASVHKRRIEEKLVTWVGNYDMVGVLPLW
jgi:hypothetical protein